tara:strand:+ start:202 stop:303 length:102 start_codon:yes stop_codon:yes gene_type:complete
MGTDKHEKKLENRKIILEGCGEMPVSKFYFQFS